MSTQSGPNLFSEDDLLPLSAVADLVFCERRAALHHIERIWEDNVFTVEGTHLHDRSDEPMTEVRGDIRVARALRLRSLRLGLSGKADVVEFCLLDSAGTDNGMSLKDVDGLWRPVPVEYKRGRLRQEEAYEVQLCAQALCLEEMLNVEVPAGAIYYGQTRRRQELAFTQNLRAETEAAIARLHELLTSGVTPKSEPGPKCERCSLLNVCLPKATGGQRSVDKYLTRAIAESEANTS